GRERCAARGTALRNPQGRETRRPAGVFAEAVGREERSASRRIWKAVWRDTPLRDYSRPTSVRLRQDEGRNDIAAFAGQDVPGSCGGGVVHHFHADAALQECGQYRL